LLIVPEEPEGETLRVPVLRVFDGDGFLTRVLSPRQDAEKEFIVRFGFIDAPEMGQPGGQEAKDFLESLIGGQWVDLSILFKADIGSIFDRHGRVVAVPYLRQMTPAPCRNIELEMVLNGWAWVLDRYGPDPRYLQALEDARMHRRGIWARDDNIHPGKFKGMQNREKRKPENPERRQDTLFERHEAVEPCPADGCRGHIVTRNGKFGLFYGCSEFPKCRYSRPARD
jgi:micrococcal nuclease